MTTQNSASAAVDHHDQQAVRAAKREQLLASGREAYPVQVPRTHALAEVRERFDGHEPDWTSGETVSVTGRVVFLRNTGKLCFATLQESGADGEAVRLQVMVSLAAVGEESLAEWKKVVDLGDFLSVTGEVIVSRRGELSIMASAWEMASKALRPLPVLHADLNEETRVRQRYADLIVREEARRMVYTRAKVTSAVRRTLEGHGYVEVETPMLQLVHGGALALSLIHI